jgi:predicted MFS family arabinose efflux permease
MLMLAGFGSGLGPYSVGFLSDRATGGDIRFAMLSVCLAAAVLGITLLWKASRTIEHDEATLVERARLAGEVC